MANGLSIETRGDQVFVEGVIDEHANLMQLLDRARNERLILDLAGIKFINSIGVRDWIRMQQAAAKVSLALELRRVAIPLIHQLNIVPATRGVSIVSSFFAPYECEHCDAEHEMVLDVRLHGAALAKLKAPEMPCPDCKRPMAFTTPPEIYFTFLAGG